jgi:DNA-directed RNA polymerase specialized sigma24 family protein
VGGGRLRSMELDGAAELQERLRRLARTEDSAVVAVLSTELLESLRTLQQTVSRTRDDAVLALHSSGMTLHEIARTAGLTRGRVFQIVQRGRAS